MKTLTVALALLLGLGLVGTDAKAEDSPEALMTAGLDALYAKGDPEGAATAFRKVLEQNPSHKDEKTVDAARARLAQQP